MGRLDRYGEPLDDAPDDQQEAVHDPRCRRGWLGEDDQGRPVPCRRCHPRLFPEDHQ